MRTRRPIERTTRVCGKSSSFTYPRRGHAEIFVNEDEYEYDFHRRRGSALLVVLWAMVVLSAAIFAWARWIQTDLQINGNANRGAEALAMAHSGVAVALNPAVTKQTAMLQEELGDSLGYRVRITSAGGKLNVGWLLQGEDQRKIGMLKLWLSMRGFSFREIDTFVDCLLDWVDADNLHRLNGVEDDGDYHAANRPLISIDEMMQVRGSGPLMKSPGWKDQLTLDSMGPLDLLAAPAPLLRMIPGLGEARIQRLLTYRAGRDGIDGTADDPEIKSIAEVFSLLGMSPAEQQQLGDLVSVNDPTVRIFAEGHSGKVVRQVEVLARKSGGYPQILSWTE